MFKKFSSIILIIPVLVLTLSGSTNQDLTAPVVEIEVLDRVLATEPFDLNLHANEPVDYDIKYGDLEVREVAQNYSISLLALEGNNDISIVATDGAGNKTEYSLNVYGIELLRPEVELPTKVIAGQAIGISISWPESQIKANHISALLNSQPVNLFFINNIARVIIPTELGSPARDLQLEVSLEDNYGRTVKVDKTISVVADPTPVQELNIPASTLSKITDEGRDKERQMLQEMYAESAEHSSPLWNSEFILPISGTGTSGFGVPRRYVKGGRVSYHHGEDLAAGKGTKVHATNDGIVLVAGFYAIKGGFVAIDHGAGVISLYFHQSKLLVAPGQKVAKGDIIGEVGTTGLSTGPHLHWEMRVNKIATDPMDWVGKIVP